MGMLAGYFLWIRWAFLLFSLILVSAVAAYYGHLLSDGTRHVLGYLGLGLILLAQYYLWAKFHPRWRWGWPIRRWLRLHMALALGGAFLILFHAASGRMPRGLALMAVVAMLATAASGITGALLHGRALRLVRAGEERGLGEDELFLLSLTEETFRRWREVHHPITYAFFFLAGAHLMAMLLLLGWLAR